MKYADSHIDNSLLWASYFMSFSVAIMIILAKWRFHVHVLPVNLKHELGEYWVTRPTKVILLQQIKHNLKISKHEAHGPRRSTEQQLLYLFSNLYI